MSVQRDSQLDMFAKPSPAVARARAPSRRPTSQPAASSDEDMARTLEESGNYRVLRKLTARPIATVRRPEFSRLGVILDTETTGLNHRNDEIIEIGAVAFTFDDDGAIGDIVGIYGGLQQPSRPIPPEVTRLTGITDAMVEGQVIDIRPLSALIEPADLIIAHNAGFDRPFCEAFSRIFAGKAWACSVSEIDWSARGFEGTKLGYLVGQAGYFHAHTSARSRGRRRTRIPPGETASQDRRHRSPASPSAARRLGRADALRSASYDRVADPAKTARRASPASSQSASRRDRCAGRSGAAAIRPHHGRDRKCRNRQRYRLARDGG